VTPTSVPTPTANLHQSLHKRQQKRQLFHIQHLIRKVFLDQVAQEILAKFKSAEVVKFATIPKR